MALLSDAQLVAVARSGGFRDGVGYQGLGLTWAVAVALAESAGRTDATGYNPGPPASYDRGLWQINNYWHPEVSDATAYDPYGCAQVAYRISSAGTDWTPWAAFNNGSAGELLTRASTAVAGAPYGGPIPTGTLPPLEMSTMADAQAIIDAAVAFAVAQLGDPYVWGGTGPDAWDCSGLTQAAYAAGGLALPRTAAEQYAATPQVDPANPQKGDLVFQYMGADDRQDHVGIYEGDGWMINAPRTGELVQRTSYSVFPGRAVTRPTARAMVGGSLIHGCAPLPPTPTGGDLALMPGGLVQMARVHFLPSPITSGASASGADYGIRPCVTIPVSTP